MCDSIASRKVLLVLATLIVGCSSPRLSLNAECTNEITGKARRGYIREASEIVIRMAEAHVGGPPACFDGPEHVLDLVLSIKLKGAGKGEERARVLAGYLLIGAGAGVRTYVVSEQDIEARIDDGALIMEGAIESQVRQGGVHGSLSDEHLSQQVTIRRTNIEEDAEFTCDIWRGRSASLMREMNARMPESCNVAAQ